MQTPTVAPCFCGSPSECHCVPGQCLCRPCEAPKPLPNDPRVRLLSHHANPRTSTEAHPVIPLIITLLVVGLLIYVVESLIPLDATVKRLIQVCLVVAVCVYLLRFAGLF